MNKQELTKKLDAAVNFFKSELAQVRTGRANPSLVEELKVTAYGSAMTVRELGTIAVPEPQMITISPWDKTLIPVIAKAIRESELKLNPSEEGGLVRIPIPALTEERRKEFAKLVSAKVEESKQAIRNIRQDAMKMVEKEFTDKLIGEDEKFTRKDEIEETVRTFVSNIEALGEEKKSDILKI